MEEILHHLGWLKPYQEWDKQPFSTGAGFRCPIHRITIGGKNYSQIIGLWHCFNDIITIPTTKHHETPLTPPWNTIKHHWNTIEHHETPLNTPMKHH